MEEKIKTRADMNRPSGNSSNTSRNNDTIDLIEMAMVLLSKLWIIILCAVIGLAGFGYWSYAMITPTYQARSMIYVYTKTTSITALTDLQIGTQLTNDFMVIGKSHEVIDEVISELDLDTSYESLCNTIQITNPSDSRILEISVINEDPVLAADISNTTANVLRQRISEVLDTEAPSVLEKAPVPTQKYAPNNTRNALKGGLIGGFLAAAIIILLYLMDDRIQNEQDVAKYLGLNTLAAVPYERRPKDRKQKSSEKKAKKKPAKET